MHDGSSLDREIDELERSIPNVGGLWGGVQRHDWRAVWDQCRKIQEGFKAVRYPTVAERQMAWERFCRLRNEASDRKRREDASISDISTRHRDAILTLCERARWSRVLDAVFFFDKTTVSEMKQLGGLLSQARRSLTDFKGEMLRDDKQACFSAIQDAQASHDEFWSRYKEQLQERQREYLERKAAQAQRQAQWEARKQERASAIRHNLERNREKLERALHALERARSRAYEAIEKSQESKSEKWQIIYLGWAREAQAKIEDISGSVNRISSWIEEDERKLRDML